MYGFLVIQKDPCTGILGSTFILWEVYGPIILSLGAQGKAFHSLLTFGEREVEAQRKVYVIWWVTYF